jgi:DNA ligase-associated metallophosphoesterase
MTPLAFRFRAETMLADPTGALAWPCAKTVIVADLHLEKGSAYAAYGAPLPPYDSRETLRRLGDALRRHEPRQVISLGDSFHDADGPDRLGEMETVMLRKLMQGRNWVWVAGNHDPAPPASLGGTVAAEFCAGGLVFRHEASARPATGEISGHFHPKAAVRVRGRHISRPCFVTNAHRLILPAFGAYTGGLDVRAPAIERLMGRAYTVMALGRTQVHPIARRSLLPPAPERGGREPRMF